MARSIPNSGRWEELAPDVKYDALRLAERCGTSPRQMRRQFRSTVGMSPQQWLDELRLHRAKELLSPKEMIKDVALTLGFKQHSHFCREFKAYTGMTPSEFVASKV